jgi:hypothetical protein
MTSDRDSAGTPRGRIQSSTARWAATSRSCASCTGAWTLIAIFDRACLHRSRRPPGPAAQARAQAGDPALLAADCQRRAAERFEIPRESVTTRAEGRRTDGTYPVNGSATILGGRTVTFQCNYARDGLTFTRIVVN